MTNKVKEEDILNCWCEFSEENYKSLKQMGFVAIPYLNMVFNQQWEHIITFGKFGGRIEFRDTGAVEKGYFENHKKIIIKNKELIYAN